MIFNKIDKTLSLWIKNGIIALAIAGIYSIFLVALRAPQVSQFFPDKSFFKTALVVHVNLSVLVWLLSGMAIIWSMNKGKTGFEGIFAKIAFFSMLLMAASPFIGSADPVMNNYIPMLENLTFILGLCLFGVALLLFAFQTILVSSCSLRSNSQEDRLIGIVSLTSSLMFILIWLCFILSFQNLVHLTSFAELDIDFYYEMLYWSGGHLLQFIYTQIVMFVWILLFRMILQDNLKFNKIYYLLFILNFIVSLGILYGHMKYNMEDSEFKEFFTKHMKHGGGLVPSLFLLVLLAEFMKNKIADKAPKFVIAALASSFFLFFAGGLIGVIISGVNVTIPAHYHGMIVGISVALMGLVYLYCYEYDVTQSYNSATWQIYIFTFGQILHIMGLALAGGYGVMRKNPGEEIALSAKIYMGMVGGGGLIAIIGGLMFVYICARKLYEKGV